MVFHSVSRMFFYRYEVTKYIGFMVALLGAAQGACPSPALLSPCTCSWKLWSGSQVRCRGFENLSDLQCVFDATLDYPFDGFSLEDSELPHLRAAWIVDKRMRTLVVLNSTLINLFDRPPPPAPHLLALNVQDTRLLRRLQWPDLQHLDQLRQLNASGTEVRRLGKGFREHVSPRLSFLHLQDTRTVAIEEGALEGKRDLAWIWIRKCRLRVLKNAYFEHQKASAMWMDFSHNPIEWLPDDLFRGFRRLSIFYLNGARLKTIQQNLSEGLAGGSSMLLQVYDNPLVCNCQMKWVVGGGRREALRVWGRCDAPSSLRSRDLRELTERDFEACGSNALPLH